MVLAWMLNEDEDALFCDLAETYHLFDWAAVPIPTLARLASGLRDDSRIVMKLGGQHVPLERLLLAMVADNTAYTAWANTKAAHDNPENVPERIVPALLGIKTGGNRKAVQSFKTAEEFEAKLASLRSRNVGN